jgi:hypothetical protein
MSGDATARKMIDANKRRGFDFIEQHQRDRDGESEMAGSLNDGVMTARVCRRS